MTTQFLGKEAIETLRADNPSYRLREVDQTAPAGMWQIDAQGGDLLFQFATAADWSAFTTVVTMNDTPGVVVHGTITFSGTIVFSANVRLDDDIVVLFGDDSDYYMGYSATDDALEIGVGDTITTTVAMSIDSSQHLGIGAAASASNVFNIAGDRSASRSLVVQGAVTLPTGGGNGEQIRASGSIITPDDGGTYNVSTVRIHEPNVTKGTSDTLSTTASLYIVGVSGAAPAGSNYAIWVGDGTSLFEGNVGIGAAPTTLSNTNLYITGATTSEVHIQTTGATSYPILRFKNVDGSTNVGHWAISVRGNDENKLRIFAEDVAEGMVITTAGEVGIGTTDPQYTVHVEGGASTSVFVKSTTGDAMYRIDGYRDQYIIMIRDGTAKWAMTNNTAGSADDSWSLYDYPNNAQRLVVLANGNVGIGTTDPATLLQLGEGTEVQMTAAGSIKAVGSNVTLSRSGSGEVVVSDSITFSPYGANDPSISMDSTTGALSLLDVPYNQFNQADGDEIDYVSSKIMTISAITDWTTYATVNVDPLDYAWTKALIQVWVGGHTSERGSGTVISNWTIDLSDTDPSTGGALAGAEVSKDEGTFPPQVRITVSGANATIQVNSEDGSNQLDGAVYIKCLFPRGAGSNGAASRWTVTWAN